MTKRAPLLAIAMLASQFALAHAETAAPANAERFSFPGDGLTLSGHIVRPAQRGAGPLPAVIMLHGCAGYLDRRGRWRERDAFWASFVAERGYVAVYPNSFEARGLESICAARERKVDPGEERRADALALLRHLPHLPDIRQDRVLLMGWSHGAMTALELLDRSRPDPATASLREALLFYPGCFKFRERGLAAVAPTTLLLGESDDWTPAVHCLAMAKVAHAAAPTIATIVYAGAYHNFDHPNLPLRRIVARNESWREAERNVHVGTDPAARADAIRRVEQLLASHRTR